MAITIDLLGIDSSSSNENEKVKNGATPSVDLMVISKGGNTQPTIELAKHKSNTTYPDAKIKVIDLRKKNRIKDHEEQVASGVIIRNQTAFQFRALETAERPNCSHIGRLADGSNFPKAIDPGSNAYFLHLSHGDHTDGSKGILQFSIQQYNAEKNDFICTGKRMTLLWDTPGVNCEPSAQGGNRARFKDDDTQMIETTQSKIFVYGSARVSDKSSRTPIYTYTFNEKQAHKDVDCGDMCQIL